MAKPVFQGLCSPHEHPDCEVQSLSEEKDVSSAPKHYPPAGDHRVTREGGCCQPSLHGDICISAPQEGPEDGTLKGIGNNPMCNQVCEGFTVHKSESLKERYIKNAAVIPELRPRLEKALAERAASTSSLPRQEDEPLWIHGLSVEEYQQVFRSVVDPMFNTSSGDPRPYSLELGREIKQKLWEALNCPRLEEIVHEDGRVEIKESFTKPGCKRKHTQIDTTGEILDNDEAANQASSKIAKTEP
ncbi:uncharacterized protein LOC136771776 [Amia ocellicauda]|uniref:uncharacterized protein LOC136771776 n=1 Tax=Amia ocellicauda TaxID=2972642 RepID=UPI003464AF5F